MIDINLLIKKTREVKSERLKTIASVILIITVAVVGFLSGTLYGHKLWREKQIKDSTRKIQELKNKQTAFGDLEEKATTLQAQIKNFKILKEKQVHFSSLIRALANTTPSSIRLTQLEAKEEGTLKLSGEAKNYQEVSFFLARLQEAPILDEKGEVRLDSEGQTIKLFPSVNIKSSSAKTSANKTVYEFDLELIFNPEILKG